jgi:hypothetical protein
MPKLSDFLEAGLEGISKRIDLKRFFEEYAQGEDRTLVLRTRSARGEEEFGFYVDTRDWKVGITDSYAIPQPTVRITVDEDLAWLLVARHQNLFSAYFQNLPVRVEGDFVLRDILILDKLLQIIHDCLLAEGIDMAAILGVAP